MAFVTNIRYVPLLLLLQSAICLCSYSPCHPPCCHCRTSVPPCTTCVVVLITIALCLSLLDLSSSALWLAIKVPSSTSLVLRNVLTTVGWRICLGSVFSCPRQLNRWPRHSVTDWLLISVFQSSCDLSDNRSEWRGDMTWPTRRHRQKTKTKTKTKKRPRHWERFSDLCDTVGRSWQI